MDTYEQKEAELAAFPNLVEKAARTMLANRALAAALLQLDSNPKKYADICRFLDDRVKDVV